MKIINIIIIVIIFFNITTKSEEQKIQNFKLYDLNNKSFEIDKDVDNKIFIFWSTPNCSECFLKLNQYFKNYKDSVYIIAKSENSFYSKKQIVQFIKSNYDNPRVLFNIIEDYSDTLDSNNIFKYYKTDLSPSILYVKNKTFNYISYDKLFGEGANYKETLNQYLK